MAIGSAMNWEITLLEAAETGLFVFALWIPFRMGRAGLRSLWCILAGWFALAGLMVGLAFLSLRGNNDVDSDLVNAMPDGQIALPFLLFGWVYAWGGVGNR